MAEIALSSLRTEEFEHFAIPLPQRVSGFPTPRHFGAGRVLCRQDEFAESVFFIERGLVKLIRGHRDGHTERIVGLRAHGWVIGAAAAIANEPCVATAVTAVPSRVARMPATEFRRLLVEDPACSWRVHQMHAREVCAGLHQLGEEASPALERLESLLRALVPAADCQPIVRNDLPLRQWEIAQLVGVRPQYVSVLLAQLGLDGTFRGHSRSRRRTNNSEGRESRAALVP